jgi:hypothetical protein
MRPAGNRLSTPSGTSLPIYSTNFWIGTPVLYNVAFWLAVETDERVSRRASRAICIRSDFIFASILFFLQQCGIKSAHLQPIDLSPSTRAEIRELAKENVPPEVRERKLTGSRQPASPENAALKEQLKDEPASA